MARRATPRRTVRNLPETVSAWPDTSTHEAKPESNPFTSGDWRMLGYAWTGFIVRIALVIGGIFSVYQYLEAREEKRVERTLQLVDLWEKPQYQEAERAISSRLADLNEQYSGLLGSAPSEADLAVYRRRVGMAALTEEGGGVAPAAQRDNFERVLYFLNRRGLLRRGRTVLGRCRQELLRRFRHIVLGLFCRLCRATAQAGHGYLRGARRKLRGRYPLG